MSYYLYLVKLKDDLETEIPFSAENWEKCALDIPNLKLDKPEFKKESWEICAYIEKFENWLPILRIEPQTYSTYINQNIIQHKESFAKLVEVAMYFEAFILGEDGTIIFLPGYGLLMNNDWADDDVMIDLYTLIGLKNKFGNDFQSILQTCKPQPKEETLQFTQKFLIEQKYTYQLTFFQRIWSYLGV